jgi:hypothetical protein
LEEGAWREELLERKYLHFRLARDRLAKTMRINSCRKEESGTDMAKTGSSWSYPPIYLGFNREKWESAKTAVDYANGLSELILRKRGKLCNFEAFFGDLMEKLN